ncbi:MAG TPA: RluA family pseudouridine synthase, partial [Polyangiaceae bacterium]|nr:RluA family pseudouridine synthase [Polyangiaceae bacterium]
MAFEFQSESFCAELSAPTPLEQVLRNRYPGASWSAIRKLVSTGKVVLGGAPSTEARQLVAPGSTIQIRMTAPRPRPGSQLGLEQLLYCDPQVVVVKKPAGISSVVHEDEPTSLQEQVRGWLAERERRPCPPLKVVHRLDKVTSGVMLFARTAAAQAALKEQFRAHTTGRYYIAVAHGRVEDATLSFRLVRNRGDGLRGITKDPNQGTHSVTHVTVREQLARCSVLECRLETGRTHQIRIHLSTIGHPIVGDPVYGREHTGPRLDCPRTLLHASFLSFAHPTQRQRLSFEHPLPEDFESWLRKERGVLAG